MQKNQLTNDKTTNTMYSEYEKQKIILQGMRSKKIQTLLDTIPIHAIESEKSFQILKTSISTNKDYFSDLLGNENDRATLAFGLGVLAMILKAVSLYLNIPLLYDIIIRSSKSVIIKEK